MQNRATPEIPSSGEKWLQEVTTLPLTASPSLGLGEDLRLENQKVIGSGLKYEDVLVYLAVFPKAGKGSKSGLVRASRSQAGRWLGSRGDAGTPKLEKGGGLQKFFRKILL
jgi:hypothetical protein